LRGQASDADERFVVEQANGLGLPVVTRAVDVREHARMHKLSIETAGRHLRLAALGDIAREHGCSWIAAGHQKNDNAETVLHRLRRGTGFRGLAGIRPVRELANNLWLARPLLCVTREQIVRYLRERGMPWREDHTNVDIAYTRNYIRHKLLPLLQQESRASLVEELADLAASAGRLYDRIQREAQEAWDAIVQTGGDEARIDALGLASRPELVAVELVRRALVSLGGGERDLTEHHYRGVLELARRQAAGMGVSLPGGLMAESTSGQIVCRVCRAHQESVRGEDGVHGIPYVLTIPGQTRFVGYEIDARVLGRDEVDATKIAGDKSPFCEYLDWDQIRPPVVVRPRQRGDRFRPLGLDAEKKVGKFLTTAKVPREMRERAIVFADREKILWVCPVRIAESVKITDGTQSILELTVRNM
jgi:tRNA(Ile)-lysidine synthase